MAQRRQPSSGTTENKPKRKSPKKSDSVKSPASEEATASQGVAVDPAAVAQMMEQMQALMSEVVELRKEVAEHKSVTPVEEDEPVSEGGEENEESDVFEEVIEEESVTAEESAELLKGLGEAMEQIEAAEAAETVNSDAVVGLDSEAAESVEEPVEDSVEVESLEADSGPDIAESVEEPAIEGSAEVAEAEEAGADVSEGNEPMSAEDIAAMVAEQESQIVEGEPVVDESAEVEESGGDEQMSAEEIAALVAANEPTADASEAVSVEEPVAEDPGAPVEAEVDEGPGDDFTNENIEALLQEAKEEGDRMRAEGREFGDFGGDEEEVQAEPEATIINPETGETPVQQEEVAELLSQEVAEEVQPETPAVSPLDSIEGDAMMSADDIQAVLAAAEDCTLPPAEEKEPEAEASEEQEGKDVLSADQISAMLMEPDPEGAAVPESAEAMDDDEIAQLMAEAESQESEGIDTGAHLESEVPKASDLGEEGDEADSPVDEEASAEENHDEEVELEVVDGKPDLGAIRSVPASLAVRALAVPVRFQGGKLVCYAAEPFDVEAIEKISKATEMGVVTVAKPIEEVVEALREAYSDIRDDHARLTLKTSQSRKPTMMDTVKSILRRIA